MPLTNTYIAIVSNSYNDRLRQELDLQQPNASDWIQTYTYDLAARMTGIASLAGTFAYTYNVVRSCRVMPVSVLTFYTVN